jgi:2-polyprenyl-6-methoxyphenol hydroxylase-like FAD-dependent oxidoreductase
MLARYRNKRARDRVSGILVTDSLVRLFSNDLPWLRSARGIGLAMLDFSDVPKRFLMRRMMFGF